MSKYHPQLPGGNPPSGARPVTGQIWRGIKRPPVETKDFLSEAEKGNEKADLKDSYWWGLSVWVSKEEADQGRRLFRYMERWHIACGTPSTHDCGMIEATPKVQNPHHYTWWKTVQYEPALDFEIIFRPLR